MQNKCRVFLVAIIFCVGFLFASAVNAAGLYLTPAEKTVFVKGTFSLTIGVSSKDQAMNATSGVVSFPKNKLEVISISKAGSVISLWVQEPSFSNSAGTVNFEGIVLNPGYTGSAGKILTINFKAKDSGDAPITFSSGTVLANDGQGTNIVSGLGSARISISVPTTGPAAPEATTPVPTAGVPAAPKITSTTHPNPQQWYASNNLTLSWNTSADITGTSLMLTTQPTSNPGNQSDGVVNTKTYTNLSDGAQYFHIKLRNRNGWGDIAHFQINVDTVPPEPFAINLLDEKETTNPQPKISFVAVDKMSGIDYYRLRVGENEAIRVEPDLVLDNKPYTLPILEPGVRTLVIQAFDKAGNETVATTEFTIVGLKPPTITKYPKELAVGGVLKISGTTYGNSTVTVRLKPEGEPVEDHDVTSNASGGFEIVWPTRPVSGLYAVSARVVDSLGAQSDFSPELTIEVAQRAVLRIGAIVVDYLSVMVVLISIIFLLIALIIYARYRYAVFKKRLNKEVHDVTDALHITFDVMRGDIQKQIKMLERAGNKRELTDEEEKILKRMRTMLDSAEEMIEKEIKDVDEVTH